MRNRARVATAAIQVFLFFLAPSLSLAEPPQKFETPWGELHLFYADDPVRYALTFKARSAEERLPLPDGFPSIVACRAVTREEILYLPLRFDVESGSAAIELPDGFETPAPIDAYVAESVTQIPDGSIVFPANAGKVVGKPASSVDGGPTAKLESNGAHHRIGFWTDPADYVSWVYDATRWGRYQVLLTYSTESPDGGVATIEAGNERIDVELPSTGSWYDYRTIDAGNLYLAKDGKQELIVRAKKLTGPALMNLKAVLLLPTFESDVRAAQAEDGSVTLHARDARVQGTRLRYEPKPEKNTLGFWTEKRDAAHWSFDLREPGEFDVEVWLGCGTGQGGSRMVLHAGGTALHFDVEETGHFQNFVPRVVGRARFAEAGRHHLSAMPLEIAKAAACDIRQIRLIPVAPAKP